jgi:hypothetical protein
VENFVEKSINGYLFITDITGYTAYLNHSELDHAQDSLKSILNTLIEETKLPLLISRLEGDAIVSYAPEKGLLQGQTLVDMVEKTYIAFRRALELMVLNTSCTCRACGNLPNLDLKFFVHFGSFAFHQLASYTELIGNDVNTIHRLTKNTITEKTGIKAYVLYTEAAIEALRLPEMVNELTPHLDEYDHIGKIQSYIGDMHPLWEREKDSRKLAVTAADAGTVLEMNIPLEPARFWDYITLPENYALINSSTSVEHQNLKNGRVRPGSMLVCAHGKSISRLTIIDWQPFKQFTVSSEVPNYKGTTVKTTYTLEPSISGTKLSMLFGKIEGGNALMNKLVEYVFFKIMIPKGYKYLEKTLTENIEQGNTVGDLSNLTPMTIPPDVIETAVRQSLHN